MIPDYSSLIKDIDALRARGYRIASVEINPITLQFLSGQNELKLTNADDPPGEKDAGTFYDVPLVTSAAVPFGQYRIRTKEPYEPQLREDLHK